MNLNQQSSGAEWETHKHLMKSTSPIVDCGAHYVDVMCQMTQSKPVSVHAVGARLTDEIDEEMYNYGQLQVTFENGSVGWYEAGWGPMMSETAFFVKDVIGPKGCVSIVEQKAAENVSSSTVDDHSKTNQLLVHSQERNAAGAFVKKDEYINTSDEPDHQGLCDLEQKYLLKTIQEDIDLSDHLNEALESMSIVLAADESIRTGKVVFLK
jgi:predicted dehydrogenase